MSEISIRPACQDDADFLSWAILAATRSHLPRGWFDIALQRPEDYCLNFLRRLTTSSVHAQWHFSHFKIAERCGRAVATLATFSPRSVYPLAHNAIRLALSSVGASSEEEIEFWKRGSYIFSCTSRPDYDAWVIEIIATLTEYRGRGYGAALLEHAFCEARASGASSVQVTCFLDNEAARRAYEGAGFRVTDERRSSQFEVIAGSPGILRLSRPL